MLRYLPLAALALAAPTQAYWEYGHETVAQVAMAKVKPSTARAVRRILADQALLGTPECPVRTPEEASYWADCIKPLKDAAGQQRYGYAREMQWNNNPGVEPTLDELVRDYMGTVPPVAAQGRGDVVIQPTPLPPSQAPRQ